MNNVTTPSLKYCNIAKELYKNDTNKNQARFLVELQAIMVRHGVAKPRNARPGK